MSILIKGMEMPRSCNECPMSVDGYCVCVKHTNGDALNRHYIPLWCPLIEIPPHGRLIDADALVETFSGMPMDIVMLRIINDIKYQPTVIEADEDVVAYEKAMEEFKKNPKTYTLDEVEAFIEAEGRE